MSRPSRRLTPEKRQRADAHVNRITSAAVVVATGVTAVIGFAVAKEHPGKSSAAAPTGSRDRTDDVGAGNRNIDTDVRAPFRRDHRYDRCDTRQLHAGKIHARRHGDRDRDRARDRDPKDYSGHIPANDAKHYASNDAPDDNDHHQTTDDHHPPSRRDLGRHFTMMARVESAFGERTFRAIGTTATVVVLDSAKAGRAEAIVRD